MSHCIPYFAGILSGVLLTLLWGNYLNWRDDRAAQRRGRFIEAVREPVDTSDRDAWDAQDVRPSRATAIADLQEQREVDAAIRRESELHGRRHLHAGEQRASLESTR